MKKNHKPPFAQVPKYLITAQEIDDSTFRLLAYFEGEKDKPREDGKPWTFSVPGVAKALKKPKRTVRSKFQLLSSAGALVPAGKLNMLSQVVPIYRYQSGVLLEKFRTAAKGAADNGGNGGGVRLDGGTECTSGGKVEQERRQDMPNSNNDCTKNEIKENESSKNGVVQTPYGNFSSKEERGSYLKKMKKMFHDAANGDAAALPRPTGEAGGGFEDVEHSKSSGGLVSPPSCADRRPDGSEEDDEEENNAAASPAASTVGSISTALQSAPRFDDPIEHKIRRNRETWAERPNQSTAMLDRMELELRNYVQKHIQIIGAFRTGDYLSLKHSVEMKARTWEDEERNASRPNESA